MFSVAGRWDSSLPPGGPGKRTGFLIPVVFALSWAAGCSHAPQHEIVLKYDKELSVRLGRAKKAEIQELMGEPQTRDLLGDSEVWLYQFDNSEKPGKGRPEVHYVAPDHDELILSFDGDGVLQKYNVVMEGRSTKRGKGGQGGSH
jgi:outer membrane protein assembly factor BamE (lipoprotein component of BamABCDE complex)